MDNIFIAHTPYHIVLAYGIARKNKSKDNILLIVFDFLKADDMAEILKSSPGIPFKEIEFLPGAYGYGGMRKRINIRKNIKTIRKIVNSGAVGSVYIFNDSRAENQALLHYAQKKNGSVKGVYVEDGVASYSSYVYPSRSVFKMLIGKMLYGWFWSDVRILGASSGIGRIMATFPVFVRNDIGEREIMALQKEDFLSLKNEVFFKKYAVAFESHLSEINKADALIIIEHSGIIQLYSPEYEKITREVVGRLLSLKLKLAVKYHPREESSDFLLLADKEGISILPRSFPLELFYIMGWLDNTKIIIGDVSTSLLTARWLLDGAKVVSTAPIIGYRDSALLDVFRKSGITVAEDQESFLNELKPLLPLR